MRNNESNVSWLLNLIQEQPSLLWQSCSIWGFITSCHHENLLKSIKNGEVRVFREGRMTFAGACYFLLNICFPPMKVIILAV